MARTDLIFRTEAELYEWATSSLAGKFHSACEGCPEEALLAGLDNAETMADEGEIESDEHFMEVAYAEFHNMGYDR